MKHISKEHWGCVVDRPAYIDLDIRNIPKLLIKSVVGHDRLIRVGFVGVMQFKDHAQVVVFRRTVDSWLVYTKLMVPLDWMTPFGVTYGPDKDYYAWPLEGRKLPAVLEFFDIVAFQEFITKLMIFYGRYRSEVSCSAEELTEILVIDPPLASK